LECPICIGSLISQDKIEANSPLKLRGARDVPELLMFDRMSLAFDEASQWFKRGVGPRRRAPARVSCVPFILKAIAVVRDPPDALREAGSLINLIDRDWYLTCYPDAAASEMGAVRHYLKVGAALHYDPNPYFRDRLVPGAEPDVAASGLAPIVHFIRVGAPQGRNPSSQFHTKWYLNKVPDVAASRTNPLEHFIRQRSRLKSRSPNRFAPGTFHSDFFSIDFRENLGCLTEGVAQEALAAFNARSTNIEDLLPSGTPRRALVDTSTVHIVIPVYRGVAENHPLCRKACGLAPSQSHLSENSSSWTTVRLNRL